MNLFEESNIKFNGGRGALLCYKCRVILKENLTKKEFEGRSNIIFCDKHLQEYIESTEEPTWVCFDCAKERRAYPPPNHKYTVHTDICGICQNETSVTEPRDFGLTRNRLRILKKEKND